MSGFEGAKAVSIAFGTKKEICAELAVSPLLDSPGPAVLLENVREFNTAAILRSWLGHAPKFMRVMHKPASGISARRDASASKRQYVRRTECATYGEFMASLRIGEGGIRTLGSLLDYGALAKLCFRPLSHLTSFPDAQPQPFAGRGAEHKPARSRRSIRKRLTGSGGGRNSNMASGGGKISAAADRDVYEAAIAFLFSAMGLAADGGRSAPMLGKFMRAIPPQTPREGSGRRRRVGGERGDNSSGRRCCRASDCQIPRR